MTLILSGTAGLSDVDGSAATPAIRGTDTNTGIFFPAADTIAFAEGGVEAMRLDSSGNVGINTTSPGGKFNVDFGNYAGVGARFQYNSSNTPFCINALNSAGETYISWNAAAKLSSDTATRVIAAAATKLEGGGGQFIFYNTTSSTAGSDITWSERMRLDASGNLLVGTTSSAYSASGRGVIEVGGSSTAIAALKVNGSGAGYLYHDGTNLSNWNLINGALIFGTNNTERARIDSSGNFLVGKTSDAGNVAGVVIRANGETNIARDSSEVMNINRITNDGDLVRFRQDNTVEGSISVSGTTVSYNGGHLARWAQTTTAKDESLVKGTVLSNLDEMNIYTDEDGNPVTNEQLNKVQVSAVEGDVNVAGVFVNWTFDEQHNVDEINMAMTGDMIIRIAQGTTVQRGDLLMSAGDGTAKPQGDDVIRSKTVAKVTSTHITCTYADGSYCVPCVLMAC